MGSIHNKLKKLQNIPRSAVSVMRGSLMVGCAMLLGSAAIFADISRFGFDADLYCLALELYRAPAGVLLVAIIGAAIIGEKVR